MGITCRSSLGIVTTTILMMTMASMSSKEGVRRLGDKVRLRGIREYENSGRRNDIISPATHDEDPGVLARLRGGVRSRRKAQPVKRRRKVSGFTCPKCEKRNALEFNMCLNERESESGPKQRYAFVWSCRELSEKEKRKTERKERRKLRKLGALGENEGFDTEEEEKDLEGALRRYQKEFEDYEELATRETEIGLWRVVGASGIAFRLEANLSKRADRKYPPQANITYLLPNHTVNGIERQPGWIQIVEDSGADLSQDSGKAKEGGHEGTDDDKEKPMLLESTPEEEYTVRDTPQAKDGLDGFDFKDFIAEAQEAGNMSVLSNHDHMNRSSADEEEEEEEAEKV
eukprot:jgi/Bigna1/129628/aug1.9_g4336